MANLNWKERPIRAEVLDHTALQMELKLRLKSRDKDEFLSYLEGVYLRNEGELRIQLENQWTLYWKARMDGSRALLAHPQLEQWVATFALEESHGKKIISELKALPEGGTLSLSKSIPLAYMSNLELTFLVES